MTKFSDSIALHNNKPEQFLAAWLDTNVKPKRDEKLLVINTIPYTPPGLINEIINHILPIKNRCLSTPICVLYTVEIAIYLSGLGFTDITLITSEYDPLMANSADTFEYKYIFNIDVENNKNMKFDVVIGNPPYQDANHGSKGSNLWQEFLKKSVNIVNDNGYVSLITPNQWLGNGKQLFETYFKQLNPIFINNEECSKWFPGVGSYFSYYIIQKCSNNKKTEIVSKFKNSTVSTGQYDLSNRTFLPMDISPISLAIIDSVLDSNSTLGAYCDSSFTIAANKIKNGNVPKFSVEQSNTHNYRVHHTPSQVFWSNIPHRTAGVPKVLISTSSSYRKMVVETEGFSQTNICIPVPSNIDPNNIIRIYSSKLFSFINEICRFGNWNQLNVIKLFPTVDFSRTWTDQELYEHFGINQIPGAISLIEGSTK